MATRIDYDLDQAYSDSALDPSLQLHQSHHDTLHNTFRPASAVWSGTTIANLQEGSIRLVTLSGNVTSLTVTNCVAGAANSLELVITQGSGGSRTVTWPVGTVWSGSSPPTLSTTAGAVDRVILTTYDGGTTWYGDLIGKAYG